MSRLRIVVHKGLDKNGVVRCHAVQTCGMLVSFYGDYGKYKGHFQPSWWIGDSQDWAPDPSLKAWKKKSKKYYEVVRFQRVTYIRDVN